MSSREHREEERKWLQHEDWSSTAICSAWEAIKERGFADISYTTHGVLAILPLTNREVFASVYTYHNQRYYYHYCYYYNILYLALSYIAAAPNERGLAQINAL